MVKDEEVIKPGRFSMEERSLICVQCGNQFVLSAREREKLLERGFDLPKRCPDCRRNKYRDFKDDSEERGQKKKKKHVRREKGYFEAKDD